jgi:hypothetical protein
VYYSTALRIISSKHIHTVLKLGNWAKQRMGGKNNERVDFFFGVTCSIVQNGRSFALDLSSEAPMYDILVW